MGPRLGLGALALASPCLLAMSTPAGTMRTAPVETPYPSEDACLAALDRWVLEAREEERRAPTIAPHEWHLDGPIRMARRTSYQLTRLYVDEIEGSRTTTAQIHEQGCDGALHYSLADGWVSTIPIFGKGQ